MRKEIVFIATAQIVIISFYVILIYLQNDLITNGAEYQQLQDQIEELHKQNIILKVEVLDKESFRVLQQEAEQEGFVPATYIYFK